MFRILLVFSAFLISSNNMTSAKDTLVIGTVTVLPSKANGDGWDIGDGKPDIYVRVRVGGFLGGADKTRTVKNSYSATLNEKTVKVSAGDKIVLSVFDEDVVNDDPVGVLEHVLTAEDIRRGISLRPARNGANRIKSITMTFK